MSLFEQVAADIKSAMLAKEKEKLQSLRAIKAAFMLEKTKSGHGDVSDEEALNIIQKLIKQRKDAAQTYVDGGRDDLAQNELSEVKFIEVYLPAQLSTQELNDAIQEIIFRVGAQSMKEMGKVMGIASKELSGKAEGKAIAQKVKELLA